VSERRDSLSRIRDRVGNDNILYIVAVEELLEFLDGHGRTPLLRSKSYIDPTALARWQVFRCFWAYGWVGHEEAAMRTPMHWRTERGCHFQAHPLQAMFSLIASMLLAALVVLALVLSVR